MGLKNSWTLTDRQLCDCELILDGSFSPLNGFMTEEDYISVLETMRLGNGKLFPIPIVLDLNEKFSQNLNYGDEIFLCNKEGFQIAKLLVESIWKPDLNKEANLIYGTNDRLHPAVNYLFEQGNKVYVGGKVRKLTMPNHYDFKHYRLTPNAAKVKFKDLGGIKLLLFRPGTPCTEHTLK